MTDGATGALGGLILDSTSLRLRVYIIYFASAITSPRWLFVFFAFAGGFYTDCLGEDRAKHREVKKRKMAEWFELVQSYLPLFM
jgi:hypothetical protein